MNKEIYFITYYDNNGLRLGQCAFTEPGKAHAYALAVQNEQMVRRKKHYLFKIHKLILCDN